MNNIVSEMDALKVALDTETTLRQATNTEYNRGIKNGPMRVAHDAAVDAVIKAAVQLVDKADGVPGLPSNPIVQPMRTMAPCPSCGALPPKPRATPHGSPGHVCDD